MARSYMLVLAITALLLGTATAGRGLSSPAAQGRALLATNPPDTPLDAITTGETSGLELVQSSNGVGDFSGRVLSSLTGSGVNSLFQTAPHIDAAGWTDTITTTNMTNANGTTSWALQGLGINSSPTDAIQQPYVWLMDTAGTTVYKIDTVAGQIAGSFLSQPSNGSRTACALY